MNKSKSQPYKLSKTVLSKICVFPYKIFFLQDCTFSTHAARGLGDSVPTSLTAVVTLLAWRDAPAGVATHLAGAKLVALARIWAVATCWLCGGVLVSTRRVLMMPSVWCVLFSRLEFEGNFLVPQGKDLRESLGVPPPPALLFRFCLI